MIKVHNEQGITVQEINALTPKKTSVDAYADDWRHHPEVLSSNSNSLASSRSNSNTRLKEDIGNILKSNISLPGGDQTQKLTFNNSLMSAGSNEDFSEYWSPRKTAFCAEALSSYVNYKSIYPAKLCDFSKEGKILPLFPKEFEKHNNNRGSIALSD